MLPSREFIERYATETGYQSSILEKVIILGDLAGDIGRHPLLGDALALKGGTALNLGFGHPSRLSVDLDFNYIKHLNRDRMLEERPKIEAAVQELVRRKGYQVQKSADAFAGRKFYCSYASINGSPDRIELDLNYLFRIPLEAPTLRNLWQPGELDRPRLRVVGIDELIIGKLLALLDRVAIRDIWDVGKLNEWAKDALSSARFRARFIAMSAILDHPLYEYKLDKIMAKISKKAIKEDLVPMLTEKDAESAEGTIARAWDVVGPLLKLTEPEMEYVDGIARGELRLELLLSGQLEVTQLAKHPALAWKIQNVRMMQEGNL